MLKLLSCLQLAVMEGNSDMIKLKVYSLKSAFFSRVLEQDFIPNLLQHLEFRDMKQSTLNVLKTRFYSSYFTRHSGINSQGSQEFISNFLFTCKQFDIVQILNDCTCAT